jgi:cobalt-zinc-cadmium resistance protein CzcA
MGVELSDIFITLKPREQWRRARTQDELTELIQKELRDLPGQRFAMTQPIEMRMNEMISGVRSDVAAILFGDDFEVLVKKAAEIDRVLKSIPGAADVSTEQVTGQPVLQIRVKQDEIARYGIARPCSTWSSRWEASRWERFTRAVAFPADRPSRSVRARPRDNRGVLVTTPSGERIPLSRLATIVTVEGPSTIKREWYQRRITVSANVRGRDMGSFVAEAQDRRNVNCRPAVTMSSGAGSSSTTRPADA